MECRARHDISGSWYYCPANGGSGFQDGVKRGQVIDMAPEHVLREFARGSVDLRPEGSPFAHGDKPDVDEVQALRNQIARGAK